MQQQADHDMQKLQRRLPPATQYEAGNELVQISKSNDINDFAYTYFSRHKIVLPVGSTVNEATITYIGYPGSFGGAPTINYQILDLDNTPPFTNSNPGSTTGTTVQWVAVPLWQYKEESTSVDLSTLVQEFIDRAGYQPGYYIAFQGNTSNTSARYAYAAHSERRPRLNLDVTVPELAATDLQQSVATSGTNLGTPLARSTRLGIVGGQSVVSALGTQQTQWQIFLAEQEVTDTPTTGAPYPITVTTTTDGADFENVTQASTQYLDIWLPPYQDFKFRVRRLFNDGSAYENWSPLSTFTSPGYMNSFEAYQLLSNETIDPIIIT
jgi:hypothetical protein